jgi:CRP-like cAMP-binding protein
MQNDLNKQEERIEEHIQKGDTAAAVKGLYELIVIYAKDKDFEKAEALRDRLYDTDSMALTEIINANEIIEKEKAGAINVDHRRTWSKFYDRLSNEDAGLLFHAMHERTYDGGQTVYHQGDLNNRLFFVNQGQLKIVYHNEDKEILIKTLPEGSTFGDDSFFSINVCTTSVVTMSAVSLSCLERNVVESWQTEHPVLESQLREYCQSGESIEAILKRKGLDRRAYERLTISTKVSAQVISSDTNQPLSRPFTGILTDISRGGSSFFIHTRNRNTVKTLLGHRLSVGLQVPTKEGPKKVRLVGLVQGAQWHPIDKYSIHLEFAPPLQDGQIKVIRQPFE